MWSKGSSLIVYAFGLLLSPEIDGFGFFSHQTIHIRLDHSYFDICHMWVWQHHTFSFSSDLDDQYNQ